MRCLVTGGSGFIASHLVRQLLKLGREVAITARYANPVKCVRLEDEWDSLAWTFEADVRNRSALELAAAWNPDVVYHLAAFHHVGDSFKQSEECFQVNALGSANVLDVFSKSKIVYMSTSEVYGHQIGVPWDEAMTPRPQSPYAITKYAGELYALMKQKLGFPVQVVRAFNTFGPGQSSRAVIPDLVLKCLAGKPVETSPGEQTREFNFVGNILGGLVLAGERDIVPGPVNLASGIEIQIKHLTRIIHDLTKSKSELRIGALPYRPNEIMRMAGSYQKASQAWGYRPVVDPDTGLAATVEWYRKRASA